MMGRVTEREKETSATVRARMTGKQRREQLIEVGRRLFADKGFEGTTVEEIAALLEGIAGALAADEGSRTTLERAALALLDYIESSKDGFRILVRDSPTGQSTGSFASLISDVATQVEHILAAEFKSRKLDPKAAPLYAQMLVGMVALTGQWWLDSPKMKKADVAAHLVNLAWNGLANLEKKPALRATGA